MIFFNNKKKKIGKRLLAEIVLLISSIFIFRSLWTLLDSMEIMWNTSMLWTTFIGGMILTIISLRYVIKNEK